MVSEIKWQIYDYIVYPALPLQNMRRIKLSLTSNASLDVTGVLVYSKMTRSLG